LSVRLDQAVQDEAEEAGAGRAEEPSQVLAALPAQRDLPREPGKPRPVGRFLPYLQATGGVGEAGDPELEAVRVREGVAWRPLIETAEARLVTRLRHCAHTNAPSR
jgi:hypothetical protein